jgi:type II secretory pathway component PulJ
MKKTSIFVATLALGMLAFGANAQNKETAAQKAQREKMEALQRELDAVKKDKAKAAEAANKEKELIANLPQTAEIIFGAHIQDEGDRQTVAVKPTMGSRGKSRRLEGITLRVSEPSLRDQINVVYDVQLAPSKDSKKNAGNCQGNKSGKDGSFAGSQGSSCEVIGVRIRLEGAYAQYYSVYYKAHQTVTGDTAEFKDGATCGSARIEELTVWIVKK